MSKPDLDALNSHVRRLRLELVGCKQGCFGVQARDPANGHVPRIIHLERRDDTAKGAIVLGMNPGNPTRGEAKAVRDNAGRGDEGIAAALYTHFENEILHDNRYYKEVRRALGVLALDGSLLWTESVKCSSDGSLNLSAAPGTFGVCFTKWLIKELDAVPPGWPVVALGKDAFITAGLMVPHRRVLGLPHPTGSRGDFARLFPDTASSHTRALVQPWIEGRQSHLWLRAPTGAPTG